MYQGDERTSGAYLGLFSLPSTTGITLTICLDTWNPWLMVSAGKTSREVERASQRDPCACWGLPFAVNHSSLTAGNNPSICPKLLTTDTLQQCQSWLQPIPKQCQKIPVAEVTKWNLYWKAGPRGISPGHSQSTAPTTSEFSQQPYKPGSTSSFCRRRKHGSGNLSVSSQITPLLSGRAGIGVRGSLPHFPYSPTHTHSDSSPISSICPIIRTMGQGLVWKIWGSSRRRMIACPAFHRGTGDRDKGPKPT